MGEREIVTAVLDFDGGRAVSASLPGARPIAMILAGDGAEVSTWGGLLDVAGLPPIAIVGVAAAGDEEQRLHECSPGFDPARFAAHERFVTGDVLDWARERFGLAVPRERTAVYGASAGGELALALGLRHPDRFGVVLAASPGAGFRPPVPLPTPIPRFALTAGSDEPFFRENAERWVGFLRDAGVEVGFTVDAGDHGTALWRAGFARLVAWAFAGDA